MTNWMTHPQLPDARIQVPDLAVIGHELSGWRIVTGPDSEPPFPDEPATDAGEPPDSTALQEIPVSSSETITTADGEE